MYGASRVFFMSVFVARGCSLFARLCTASSDDLGLVIGSSVLAGRRFRVLADA
jgi:hypothetical protein